MKLKTAFTGLLEIDPLLASVKMSMTNTKINDELKSKITNFKIV
jgi:hypothetical protein